MSYNYEESVKDDVIDYINENWTTEEIKANFDDVSDFAEVVEEKTWVSDSVTGNASGSYTFNRYKAKEYVTDNMELLSDMCLQFGVSTSEIGQRFLDEDWEWMDVSIRCHLLSSAISDALEELGIDDDFFEEEEEEETEEN